MSGRPLKTIAHDYANLVNAGIRRQALAVGLLASLTWTIASVGVFAVITETDNTPRQDNFAQETKNTMSQYGNAVWIVALALLGVTMTSGEFKYVAARREAKRMAKYIIRHSCGDIGSKNLTRIADCVLQTMSDTERQQVLDWGVQLRTEIDKYTAKQSLNTAQRQRLINAAIIRYRNNVTQLIQNNPVMMPVIAAVSSFTYTRDKMAEYVHNNILTK